ncbi:MAG: YwiC-like family protein, partial [Candidatus Methanofastidiosia archaeon]
YSLSLILKNDKKEKTIFWFLLYTSLTLLISGFLLVFFKLFYLLIFGALFFIFLTTYILLLKTKRDRTTFGEILSIFGLSMSSPLAYYLTTGKLDGLAFILWFLNFSYFSGSVFYVKLKLGILYKRDILRRRALNLTYHIILLTFLIFLAFWELIPTFSPIAYIPMLSKTLTESFEKRPISSLRKLGFSEFFHSILFASLLTLSFHL